jgi:hypothetical protein
VFFTPECILAENRKDVTDTVLQEIISSFSNRMPRFINKHGQNVFVTDEPITRANLMLAIYEYDKSIKINIGIPDEEDERVIINSKAIKLNKFIDKESIKFEYLYDYVNQFQIIQVEKDEILAKIIPNDRMNEEKRRSIEKQEYEDGVKLFTFFDLSEEEKENIFDEFERD